MGPDQVGQILNFPASPLTAEDSSLPRHTPHGAASPVPSTDVLREVDRIFEIRSRGLSHLAESQVRADTERTRLYEEFSSMSTHVIRPAMEAFLARVRMNGGGGLLEVRDGVQEAGVSPRVRLWLSLSGELIGRPRQDQHPYLQLDFDIDLQLVNVAEGDMWKGHGSSGPVGSWVVSDITDVVVTESLIEILRRAAA
jgi:hypothetical protein